MPVSAALEPAPDETVSEYGQRLRISVAARASVLDSERRRFNQDLDLLRSRASERD
jgi:hypothetical protein